jgi:hypothetical protein
MGGPCEFLSELGLCGENAGAFFIGKILACEFILIFAVNLCIACDCGKKFENLTGQAINWARKSVKKR